MTFAGFGSRFVASREGTVPVDKDGAAKLDLDLQSRVAEGRLHDHGRGRLHRRDRPREPLDRDRSSSTRSRLAASTVTTPKELFTTSEKIPVALAPFGLKADEKPATTLIVVRLEAQPASPWGTPFGSTRKAMLPDNTRLPAIGRDKEKKPAAEGWKSVPVFDPVKRTIVDVDAGCRQRKPKSTLKQPGAYKLLAVTRLPDGTTFQSETGVVVKAPAKLAGRRAATRQARDRFRLATHRRGSHALRRREAAAHAPRFAGHQAHEGAHHRRQRHGEDRRGAPREPSLRLRGVRAVSRERDRAFTPISANCSSSRTTARSR